MKAHTQTPSFIYLLTYFLETTYICINTDIH